MRGVFNHGQAVPAGDGEDFIQVGRLAEKVHRDDGPGARRDTALDPGRVEVETVRAGIGEHRDCADTRDAARGGKEGERRANHFVAGPDAERQQRHQDGIRAGGNANAEAGSSHGGGGGFKLLHFLAEDKLPGVEDAREGRGQFVLQGLVLAAHIEQGYAHENT